MRNFTLFLILLAISNVWGQDSNKTDSVQLPSPTGNFAVGAAEFSFIDDTREDLFEKDKKRIINGQIWYPTDFSYGITAEYLDPAVVDYMLSIQYFGLDSTSIQNLKHVKTNAALNAPIAKTAKNFPIVFFVHGHGVPRNFYTSYVEEIASHGYIVFALDHPYGGITIDENNDILSYKQDTLINQPEILQTRIDQWSRDIEYVYKKLQNPESKKLNFLRRFMDFDKVAVIGHSLGGNVALGLEDYIPEIDVAINMDGGSYDNVLSGLKTSSMIIRSFPVYSDAELIAKGRSREEWDEMGREIDSLHYSIFNKSENEILYLKLRGTGHMSFSDAPYVSPTMISRFGGKVLEKTKTRSSVLNYIISFLDQKLKNKKSHSIEKNAEFVILEKFNSL